MVDDLTDSDSQTTDNNQVGNNPLPEDNDRPAADSTDPEGRKLPDDHPATDSSVDSDEAYNEGIPEAAEAGEKPTETTETIEDGMEE